MVADVCEEEEIAMPVMQPLAEVSPRPMKRVDERGFHQARFINCPARTVIWARGPFNHPVKNFKLAELRLPLGNALGTQVIHKRLRAGSRANGEERAQFFVKEIPFLFEAIEPALRFIFCSLFEGEQVFI